jgi:hypothetical protein
MTDHSYVRVHWLHGSSDDPVELWSELDAHREETRKVEIWRDGRAGYASFDKEVGGAQLGKVALPMVDEINSDPRSGLKSSPRLILKRAGLTQHERVDSRLTFGGSFEPWRSYRSGMARFERAAAD